MYGGLFGDLPPTKEQQQQQKEEHQNETQPHATPVEDNNRKNSKEEKQLSSKQMKEPPSVVRQLGTSGTAVAFIPAAARRRNLKRPSTNIASSSAKDSRINNPKDSQQINPLTTPQEALSTTTTLKLSSWVACPPEIKQKQKDEVDSFKIDHSITSSTPENSTTAPMEAIRTIKNGNDGDDQIATGTSTYVTEHTHRSDRYDPFLPNDLLEYWERKAVEETWRVQEAELARRNQEQAEQMRRHQEQTQRLATAEPPRGRGRGLSNLPAWMVEQQRRQDALGSASSGI